MKLRFAVTIYLGLLLAGCDQPTTSTTSHSATTRTTTENHYKQTGNRSADLLSNYNPDEAP